MPIDPILGGSLISGAASLGANLLQNSGSRKSQARANKHNVNFWRMQNEYNSPTSQMKRLREAGLNPNLIYGSSSSGASGNADAISPSKASDVNFDNPIDSLTKFADAKQKTVQTDNLLATNTVLQQEAILKAAQTANIAGKTAKDKFDLNLAKELKTYSLQAAKANLRNLELTTIQKQLDNEIKSEAKKDIIKDLYYKAELSVENLKGQKLLNNLRKLEVELKRIGIERNDPWYFRIIGRHLQEAKTILNHQF